MEISALGEADYRRLLSASISCEEPSKNIVMKATAGEEKHWGGGGREAFTISAPRKTDDDTDEEGRQKRG